MADMEKKETAIKASLDPEDEETKTEEKQVEQPLPSFTAEDLALMFQALPSTDLNTKAAKLKGYLETEFGGKWMCSAYEIGKSGDTLHLEEHRWRQWVYMEPYVVRVYLR